MDRVIDRAHELGKACISLAVENYIALRNLFPRMQNTWQPGWPGAVAWRGLAIRVVRHAGDAWLRLCF